MPAIMDISTVSVLIGNYAGIFSMGVILGASSVYYSLRRRYKAYQDPPTAVPIEERFEFADPQDEYRLIMAIRTDLKMQKGKVAAQCGHAAVAAYAKALKSKPKTLSRWMKYGGTKITVKVESEKELMALQASAKANNILASVIRDAGQTQVAPGSRTVIAIGPAPKSALDEITGHLKLY